jgi:drug/metabolite transporter (DMT)-like permease
VDHRLAPPLLVPPLLLFSQGSRLGDPRRRRLGIGDLSTAAAAALALTTASDGVLSAPSSLDVEPSILGDMIALLGAAFMGIYLSVGSRLRKDIALFLYAFPVTAAAAIAR